ncbi:3-hydroxybutyrate dehydrogenase precursor [Azorhizobium caulinodans ORS 571]|uniref:3-hydroxybutyrate dehydrogenase n=1 Tax=Azorhizobium caulinodans (strain ATCC 43989 / DSM 5975 / JCM 20966 / LMG 6465 / NBRC 14845 / NCIMB 13405 / ORS 571) TaxID=438753 RepID=A8ICH9_AZOC5|nr:MULTISPECIES: 3-hydroxybutyrate dehydrogenase [Azorhizobium]TDT93666.1 3-hydroxybutyrate dehydrogenase [Azorhizobium sp. AG788]BAF89209.1 3-hydroxybutyrate dehydrogenase precursor [Azorhizobium caulinodans ORS 571]
MKGRNAVVTGSTSGIGLAIARSLAAEGCNVMLNGFGEPAQIEMVRREMAETTGCTIGYSGADMGRPEEVRALIAAAQNTLGTVDILINNAGVQHVAPLVAFPEDKWDLLLAVNLSAAFHATKAVMPAMLARGFGRVVNIASALGLVGAPHKPAYVATKHGLIGLTRSVALEVAQGGVTCNVVCPGMVMTPIIEMQVADQARVTGLPPEEVVREVFLENQPIRRPVKAEEIAAAVVFLCSEAAAGITGTVLSVDGGYTAR